MTVLADRQGRHVQQAQRTRWRVPLGIAVCVALVAGTAAVVLHGRGPQPALSALQVTRATSAATAVRDSRGQTWAPGAGLVGGTDETSAGAVAGTASEDLYRHQRVGASSWTVTVPRPGRYAVDLMTAELDGQAAGQRVFDVVADGANGEVVLARGLDLAATDAQRRARHVTGWVTVSGRDVRLRFPATAGQAVVSALSLTLDPTVDPGTTLLADDFDGPGGSAAPAPWVADDDAAPGDTELQTYTSSTQNSSLDGDGHLVITARRDPSATAGADGKVRSYTSARLTTAGRLQVTYGHVEARMKLPEGTGLFPAFWMLAGNRATVPWPTSGEVDIAESLGGRPDWVSANVHALGDAQDDREYQGKPVSGVGRELTTAGKVVGEWHTYAADLQPGAVTFSLDGAPYLTVAVQDLRSGQNWPFDQPYFLLLNLAVGGDWGGPPTSSTTFPSSVLVDSVRVTS